MELIAEKIFRPIHYFVLFGERGMTTMPVVPPPEFSHLLLRLLGRLPKSLAQFQMGMDYYVNALNAHSQVGYDVNFVYAETFPGFNLDMWPSDDLFVFFICTDDTSLEKEFQRLMDRFAGYDALWVQDKASAAQWHMQGSIVDSMDGIWTWLMDRYYQYTLPDARIQVPNLETDFIAKHYSFSATYPNRWMINNIEGNWGAEEHVDEQKKMEEHHSALQNPDAFVRQDSLCEQLEIFRKLETVAAQSIKNIQDFEDYFNPPLVLTAPYNSKEIRKIVSSVEVPPMLKEKEGILTKVFDYEYTKNYTIKQEMSVVNKEEDVQQYFELIWNYVTPRYWFSDFVAMLHCSVRFSPYLRLPTMGSSISRELSFVGMKNVAKLVTGRSINEVLRNIGRKIVVTAISDRMASAISNRASQIVAISDLPVEWLMIDDVPLAFTHDVCRLPEQPLTSQLAQYVESRFANAYLIPKDIIKKTLVVFGNDEEAFKAMQAPVVELQKELGFQIRTCLSVNDFKVALEEIQPDLLIVDTHGGTDIHTRQTFLEFGKEKLYGQYVVKHHLSAKLVFLSACSTYPTFNLISSIANAFFEAGALSVTTSYLPLPLADATVLYMRLLHMLARASENGLHCNWLSFISHLLRTSYLQEPMWHGMKDITAEDRAFLTKTATDLMHFRKRRDVYKAMVDGDFAKRMGVNYNDIRPNYLLYSTLGRADLIRFESYLQNKYASQSHE